MSFGKQKAIKMVFKVDALIAREKRKRSIIKKILRKSLRAKECIDTK